MVTDDRGVTHEANQQHQPDIERAVETLRAGGLVGLPTETVYGLAGDAGNPDAVRRIFAAKGRPPDHPLIVHLGDASQLTEWAAELPPVAYRLAGAFWPGPLTLVAQRGPRAIDEVTAGLPTIAVRVPSHPLTLAVLRAFGGGVAAPSANRFGRVSPTTAQAVHDELGDAVDLVLDGGPCDVGVESTIVDVTVDPPAILRPGGIPAEALERVAGGPLASGGATRAPGTLPAHYAPALRIVLVESVELLEAVAHHVGAGDRTGVLAPERVAGLPGEVAELAPAGGPATYAQVLYERFREAERLGLEVLLCVPPSRAGIGTAVRDRLQRAARGSLPAEE